ERDQGEQRAVEQRIADGIQDLLVHGRLSSPELPGTVTTPANARSCAIVRVALFITCFNDTLFPNTGRAVVSLLERLGCQVDFPLEQTCCGQMHVNSGYAHEAAPLLERFSRVFADADVVVSPSASCVAHVREHVPGVRALELTE